MKPGKGRILILCAPSGGGKSTMAARLMDTFPRIRFSVSATTRAPRAGETDGVHYHFLTPQEFQRRVEAGLFLEHESFYNGTRYGTLKQAVEEMRDSGYFPLLDIDVKGGLRVRSLYPADSLSVFLMPPSLEVLESRLRARGTETEETIRTRMERSAMEVSLAPKFDHTVVNDELERAWSELRSIIETHLFS